MNSCPIDEAYGSKQIIDEGVIVVVFEGCLDWQHSTIIWKTIEGIIERGSEQFILDLTDACFIDSSVLSAFLRAYKLLQKKYGENAGTKMIIVTKQGPISRVFEITAFNNWFTMFPDRKRALSALRRVNRHNGEG